MKIEQYQTDNGPRYRYDFTYRETRLRRSGFLTSDEAERDALRAQLEVVGGSTQQPRMEHHCLGALLHEADVRRWDSAKDGEKSYRQAREFVALVGALVPIPEAATAPNLLRFRDYLLFERDLSHATCNRYIAAVKGMFDVAVEQGWLESSPSVRKLKETPVERKVVPSRVRVLIRQGWRCEVPGAASALFLLDTGLRLGELVRAVIEGGIQESRQVVLEDTKNGDGRKVPTQWAQVPTCPEHTLRAYLAQFNLTPHDLRHTFITDLIESGTPLPVVQKLAGHRDIKTTMRYFHLTDRGAREAMDRKEEYLQDN